MTEAPLPYRHIDDGLEIVVRLTPNAAADQIGTVETGVDGTAYLKARVRAVPESGKANAALERLVARHFGLAKSSVKLRKGHSARLKTIAIEADEVTRKRIAAELAASGEG